MEFFKTWIVPPAVGALIGYFTNWLAIKMLFRPLVPVKLGSLTLPFTPGILPRERTRLARSIGDTVAGELLTPDVLRARLVDPSMKERIRRAIFELESSLLSIEVSPLLLSIASNRDSKKVDGGVSEGTTGGTPAAGAGDLGKLALTSLGHLLHSPELSSALAEAFRATAKEAVRMPLGSILSPGEAVRLFEILLDRAEAESRKLKARSAGGAGGVAAADRAGGDTRALVLSLDILPSGAIDPLVVYFTRNLHGALAPALSALLSKPGIKSRLEELANRTLRSAIDKLGPIQRLIVTAANYENTLRDNMPRIVEELVASLGSLISSEETKAQVADAAREYIGAHGRELVTSLVTGEGRESATEASAGWPEVFAEFLDRIAGGREGMRERFRAWYASLAPLPLETALPSIGRGLHALMGVDEPNPPAAAESADSSADAAAAKVAEAAALPAGTAPGSLAAIAGHPLFSIFGSGFLEALSSRWEGKSLAEVLGIDEVRREEIADALAEAVTQALAIQAERLIEALDVKAMVVERIDALDMLEVERIILGVVERELTWITILGGVLGGAIGVVQSLVSLL